MAIHLLIITAILIGRIDCQQIYPFDEGPDDSSCECVLYYLCRDGNIFEDGTGIIGSRSAQTGSPCTHPLQVCCKHQPGSTEPSDRQPSTERRNQGCGYRNEEKTSRHVLGTDNEANVAEFPWMVVLLEKNSQGEKVYACGGTLIHQQVVLTSAHCVTSHSSPTTLYARAGAIDAQVTKEEYPFQESRVERVIIHERYNSGNHFNNIALLILEEPFQFAENVAIACLPRNNQDESDSDACLATGWGKDAFGIYGSYQTKLKKVELPVVPHDICEISLRKTRLGQYFQLDQSFLCAGGELQVDTCTGDGGSPLVCPINGQPNRYKLTGIVSWGIECGQKDVPGVYVNVPFFKNWIDQQMADQNLDTEYDYIN